NYGIRLLLLSLHVQHPPVKFGRPLDNNHANIKPNRTVHNLFIILCVSAVNLSNFPFPVRLVVERRKRTMTLRNKKALTITLWTIQGLLAALFLFAGAMKLTMPVEAMTKQMPMPGAFLRFIGVAEVLGALGLVFPTLLKIRPVLTPLAASGLIII